ARALVVLRVTRLDAVLVALAVVGALRRRTVAVAGARRAEPAGLGRAGLAVTVAADVLRVVAIGVVLARAPVRHIDRSAAAIAGEILGVDLDVMRALSEGLRRVPRPRRIGERLDRLAVDLELGARDGDVVVDARRDPEAGHHRRAVRGRLEHHGRRL